LKNFSDQSHEVLSDLKLQYDQTVIDFQKELKLCTENGAKMKQHILKYIINCILFSNISIVYVLFCSGLKKKIIITKRNT